MIKIKLGHAGQLFRRFQHILPVHDLLGHESKLFLVHLIIDGRKLLPEGFHARPAQGGIFQNRARLAIALLLQENRQQKPRPVLSRRLHFRQCFAYSLFGGGQIIHYKMNLRFQPIGVTRRFPLNARKPAGDIIQRPRVAPFGQIELRQIVNQIAHHARRQIAGIGGLFKSLNGLGIIALPA